MYRNTHVLKPNSNKNMKNKLNHNVGVTGIKCFNFVKENSNLFVKEV